MIQKIMKKMTLIISILALVIGFGLGATPAFAAYNPHPNCSSTTLTTQEQAQCGVNGVGGSSGNNQGTQVQVIIKNVINILLFLIGLIAVLMIVIAGFRFVTSNGDSNTVSSARNTILYAVIGIVIAVMAYAIVNFVLINIT